LAVKVNDITGTQGAWVLLKTAAEFLCILSANITELETALLLLNMPCAALSTNTPRNGQFQREFPRGVGELQLVIDNRPMLLDYLGAYDDGLPTSIEFGLSWTVKTFYFSTLNLVSHCTYQQKAA